MMDLKDYGSAGLVGVLTPQANTTVEPEFWALLPRGWSLINARLTSSADTIEARLVDYTTRFGATAERFANAPVSSIAAACTGASYLIGAEKEAEIVETMERRFDRPFMTAALASVAALRALNARRIALLSPYPDSLNAASKPYWQGHGFEICATSGPELETSAFHPIYAMGETGVLNAYRRLSELDVDAILMLGTGMATLGPLLVGRREGLTTAISCNVALAWASTQGARWSELSPDGVQDWCSGARWERRFKAMFEPAE